MVECEICGSAADRKAEIEGVVLNVCGSCSKFGKDIVVQQKRTVKILKLPDEMQIVFMENFSGTIKKARMKRQLSQEQLASAIKEKMSLIKRMEEGWNPPIETARKLEKFLGVKLLGAVKEAGGSIETEKKEVTIGDIIAIVRKK